MNKTSILGVTCAYVALSVSVAAAVAPQAGAARATGSAGVVPPGAPLPLAHDPWTDAACDRLGQCGSICPNSASVFIADFAYDATNGRFVVVDVPSGTDGVFWLDANDCTVSNYTSFAGISQRGCGFDNSTGTVYTASWNDDTIWWLDSDFNVKGSAFFGESFAGLAVDEANRLLYAATNASPDELIEYAIADDGSVSPTGRRWTIPWQMQNDGYATASLELDDASGLFMVINQDANAMEYFSIDNGSLVGEGACPLPVGFGWGFGLDFASVTLQVADIESFACNFPIVTVAPDERIVGGGELPDFTIAYEALTPAVVGHRGGPVGAKVRNNTQAAATKWLWLTLDAYPGRVIDLGSATFPVGSSLYYSGIPPMPDLSIPAGVYTGQIHVGSQLGGTPDDSDDVTMEVIPRGIQ